MQPPVIDARAEAIMRLMSGFRPDARYMLMALQAFFDDSGSSAQEPYYVLAGFVAEYEAWVDFSTEWAATLDANCLDCFKMREANRLDGGFGRGWNPSRRDAFVFSLSEIIAKYAAMRISAYVGRAEFDSIMKGAVMKAPDYEDPYGMLFWSVSRQVFEKQHRVGDERPCDLIFDEQGGIGLRALEWWRKWPDWIHPDRQHLIGDPPIFRSDARVVPLQAADMYAWIVRNELVGEEKWQTQAIKNVLSPIENFEIHWDRERLLHMRTNLTLNHIAFFGMQST